MEYLDFEVAVEPRAEGGYSVAVVDSPAGEARAEMQFPYDRLALSNRLQALQIALLRSGGKRRSAPTADDRAVEELGRDLFRAIFSGDVGSRLNISRIIASREGRGVRIKLRISAPELMALPWEYLYDQERGDYLALGIGTPVVRYVPLPQSIRPLEVAPPIRVLAMVSGPKDLGELDATRERQRLEIALRRLRERGIVQLDWVAGESWPDLQEALWRGPWHVFHFIGHGGFSETQGGLIYLTGDDGNSREMSATDIGRLLGDHEPLRLAVLNSCDTAQGTETDIFSSTAATLVRRGTPAVVAMQFEITDDAAIQFSRVFYAAVAYGMPVDAAVAEARKSVALQVANSYEWGTPVLFMRSRDGVLFKIPEAAGPETGKESSSGAPTDDLLQPTDLRPEPPPADVAPATHEPPMTEVPPEWPRPSPRTSTGSAPEPDAGATQPATNVPTTREEHAAGTVPAEASRPDPLAERPLGGQPPSAPQSAPPSPPRLPAEAVTMASLMANDYVVSVTGAVLGVLAGIAAGALVATFLQDQGYYEFGAPLTIGGVVIGGVVGVYAALRLRGLPGAGGTARWAVLGLLIVLVIAIFLFRNSYPGFVFAALVGAAFVGLTARAIGGRQSGVL